MRPRDLLLLPLALALFVVAYLVLFAYALARRALARPRRRGGEEEEG